MAQAIKHIKAGLINIRVNGTLPEPSPARRRVGKSLLTCTAQQFYNDKCSWRELELKLGVGFGQGNWVATPTYDDAHLPLSEKAADGQMSKYIRDIRAARRKRGQDLRYVYVTEGLHGKAEDEYFGGDGRLEDRRLHHHAVLNGCGPGDWEELQSLWRGGGYVRIEPLDVHYYRELAKYLTKEVREFGRARPGAHSWHASRSWPKYEVEYIEIPCDGVALTPPPGAVDYIQFSEKNPYGFADCVGDRYLLFDAEEPPAYSYTQGRKSRKKE